jgi:saccharopine dehydrogenase-like NADP-dependent oxidoreductase
MRAIVVGGAGAMGHIVVRDLARSPGVELVTVADLDGERAVQIAATTATESAGAEIRSAAANVAGLSFADLLADHDVCIASVAYRLNLHIVQACLTAHCNYVDLGGLFHVARRTLEFDERFREANLTGVTCMGGSPGITNLLAVMGARTLDPNSVTAIHVRLGATDPSIAGLPLPIPYSLETLLDEFSVPAMAYRNGSFLELAPISEPEPVDFPEPVGHRTVFTTLHSEVATLPRAFPTVKEVTFKISFEPGFAERLQTLTAIGLASTDPIDVRGTLVRPRDVLLELGRTLPQAEGTNDTECLRVVLTGTRDDAPTTVIAESVITPDKAWGVGGGGVDTGVPPSIVAQMIVAGEVKGPGMFAPEEAVDADRFFARIADRGVTYSVRVQ